MPLDGIIFITAVFAVVCIISVLFVVAIERATVKNAIKRDASN